jgi:hypothetical protein
VKKFLALLIILLIFAFGAVGALSVVPHAHGNDFDHSQHSSCPIYQFSVHGFNAITSLFRAIVILLATFYIPFNKMSFSPIVYHPIILSRAPPAIF